MLGLLADTKCSDRSGDRQEERMTGYGTTFMHSEATHDSYFQLSEFGYPNGDLLEFLVFSPLF